jgi:hypothetical protein
LRVSPKFIQKAERKQARIKELNIPEAPSQLNTLGNIKLSKHLILFGC